MLKLPEDEKPKIIEYVSTNLNVMLDWTCQHCDSMLDFFPAGTGPDRAFYETQSLEKLLLHSKPFTPELIQEYLMYHVIQKAIKEGYKLPPLPSDLATEVDQDGEPMYAMYGDLEEWPEVLFWDWDFMMLDNATEQELENSPIAKQMGIGSPNATVLDLDGRKVTLKMREWESEAFARDKIGLRIQRESRQAVQTSECIKGGFSRCIFPSQRQVAKS